MCLDTNVPRDNDWSLAALSKEIIHVIDDYNLDPKDRDKKNCAHTYVHTCRFYSLQLLVTTLTRNKKPFMCCTSLKKYRWTNRTLTRSPYTRKCRQRSTYVCGVRTLYSWVRWKECWEGAFGSVHGGTVGNRTGENVRSTVTSTPNDQSWKLYHLIH